MNPEPDWKKFEDFVADVERHLQGANAEVLRNASIPDSKGHRTKVEVAVRVKAGETDLLILLECRRRKKKSDRSWIDELKNRRDRLRASKIIAISNKPLSNAAADWAEEYGIDVRLLQELGPETPAELLPQMNMAINENFYCDVKFGWDYADGQLHDDFEARLNASDFQPKDMAFIRTAPESSLGSLTDLYVAIRAQSPRSFKEDLGKHHVKFTLKPKDGPMTLEVGDQVVSLSALEVIYFYENRRTEGKITQVLTYDLGSGQKTIQQIQHQMDIGNRRVTTQILMDGPSRIGGST